MNAPSVSGSDPALREVGVARQGEPVKGVEDDRRHPDVGPLQFDLAAEASRRERDRLRVDVRPEVIDLELQPEVSAADGGIEEVSRLAAEDDRPVEADVLERPREQVLFHVVA